MWCKLCNIETNESICPVCGTKTVEDIPTEVHWCKKCKVPIIYTINQIDKGHCPICSSETKYMTKDIRPVFPEEKLLLELMLEEEPNTYKNSSVWASNSRYYIDGKAKNFSNAFYKTANTEKLINQLAKYKDKISYEFFDQNIYLFCKANRNRLNSLISEASDFIRDVSSNYDDEKLVISFSGGKDSTVTDDIVKKALSNPSIVTIFGNTTLEFPTTIEYAERYRKDHPHSIFQIAKNDEQVFMDVCEDIGPPARMMRWCCSMFKTGPISRILNSLYRDQRILTFYGIRKAESVTRSKYNRVEGDSESVKIQKQTVASPIFFWTDIDVWLYILPFSLKIRLKPQSFRKK